MESSKEAHHTRGYTRCRAWRGGRGASQTYGRGTTSRGRVSRQRNPLDMQGNPTRCRICESVYHYASDCPGAYEHREKLDYNMKDSKEKFACAAKHDLTPVIIL